MEYLPKDLIYEIVLRLPVKDVIRFSSVSKLWKNAIYSKGFIKEHEQRCSAKDFTLIRPCVKDSDRFYAASFSGDTLEEERKIKRPLYHLYESRFGCYRIITVCHGLVLLAAIPSRNTVSDLCLWNPVIAKYRYINSGETEYLDVMYGIGYHCDEGDIKVLALKQIGLLQNKKIQFMIYSVASGQWKTITKLPPSNLRVGDDLCRHNMASLSDSRVAWLMRDDVDGYLYHVVTFDLVKEEYSTLRVPISIRPWSGYIVELGSFLWFRHSEKMWFVNDSSWSTEPISLLDNNYSPLLFDGERFLFSRFCDDYNKLFWYNIKTKEHQHVRLIGGGYARDYNTFFQTAFIFRGGLHLLLDGVPDLHA